MAGQVHTIRVADDPNNERTPIWWQCDCGFESTDNDGTHKFTEHIAWVSPDWCCVVYMDHIPQTLMEI